MRIIFSTIAILISLFATSQSLTPFKERYDKLYPNYHYVPGLTWDQQNCFLTGNSLSWTTSSLLNMYEATKDKAYLVKFINHCIRLQQVRRDAVTTGDPTIWVRPTDYFCDVAPGQTPDPTDNSEPVYFNSLILHPMAKFIHMTFKDPTLFTTPLPMTQNIGQDVINMSGLNQLPNYGININDYGHFALWLGYRVEQSMSYLNSVYWDSNWGIIGHLTDNCSDNEGICGGGMNWESPYGCVLLYMALTNTNFGYDGDRIYYGDKARLIASLYKKNDVDFTDLCGQNWNYNEPELRLMSNGNNSYFWYTKAMSKKKHNCIPFHTAQDDIGWYLNYAEDVAHGAMDLWFPQLCYESMLSPVNDFTPYFSSVEMLRFRNTFTKNILFTDLNGIHFHNTVQGGDNPFAGDDNCSPNCPEDFFWGEALNWMLLYKADDGSTPELYTTLITHADDILTTPSLQNLSGSQSLLGWTEVVKAQWDRECVNLTLYNRDLAYDQDFDVKNILTIAPQQDDNYNDLGQPSFADPVITSDEFIFESNVTSNITAGEYIALKPGIEFKPGCHVEMNIVPNTCWADGKMMITTHSQIMPQGFDAKLTENKTADNAEITTRLVVYPNPTHDILNYTLLGGEEFDLEVIIYNTLGQPVKKIQLNGNSGLINVTDLENGNYLIKLVSPRGIMMQRFVKQ